MSSRLPAIAHLSALALTALAATAISMRSSQIHQRLQLRLAHSRECSEDVILRSTNVRLRRER